MKLAYNIEELSAETGMTVWQIYRLIQNGRLGARKVGTRWIVPAENITTFLAERSHARTAPQAQAATHA